MKSKLQKEELVVPNFVGLTFWLVVEWLWGLRSQLAIGYGLADLA
jgi:hypothetical protein